MAGEFRASLLLNIEEALEALLVDHQCMEIWSCSFSFYGALQHYVQMRVLGILDELGPLGAYIARYTVCRVRFARLCVFENLAALILELRTENGANLISKIFFDSSGLCLIPVHLERDTEVIVPGDAIRVGGVH